MITCLINSEIKLLIHSQTQLARDLFSHYSFNQVQINVDNCLEIVLLSPIWHITRAYTEVKFILAQHKSSGLSLYAGWLMCSKSKRCKKSSPNDKHISLNYHLYESLSLIYFFIIKLGHGWVITHNLFFNKLCSGLWCRLNNLSIP